MVKVSWALHPNPLRSPGNAILISFLIMLGAALRFHFLGVKSIWLVEAFTVMIARLSWIQFLKTMWWGEANMSLYYFLLRGWICLGDGESWLRSLSVVFGVAAIPAVYAVGKRFLGERVGLIASIFLTINAFHIEYSQELRSYSLLTFLVILSSYAFLLVLDDPDRRLPWVLYVAFSSLAVYAHIFAAFVLVGQWIWLAVSPASFKRLGLTRIVIAWTSIAGLTAPIAAVVILEHKDQLDWVPPLTASAISELLQDLAGAAPFAVQGSIQALCLLGLYIVAWIAALNGIARCIKDQAAQKKSAKLLFLTSWFAFPIAAMITISLIKPIQAPRYALMCLPAAVLLASWGVVTVGEFVPRVRTVGLVLVVGIITLALRCTWNYFDSFKKYGHNGRAVSDYILTNQHAGDAVIFYTLSEHYVFDYYAARRNRTGFMSPTPVELSPFSPDRAGLEDRTRGFDRIWLVLHQTRNTAAAEARTEMIRTAVETHYRLKEELEFPGSGVDRGESGAVEIRLYVPNRADQSPQ